MIRLSLEDQISNVKESLGLREEKVKNLNIEIEHLRAKLSKLEKKLLTKDNTEVSESTSTRKAPVKSNAFGGE